MPAQFCAPGHMAVLLNAYLDLDDEQFPIDLHNHVIANKVIPALNELCWKYNADFPCIAIEELAQLQQNESGEEEAAAQQASMEPTC